MIHYFYQHPHRYTVDRHLDWLGKPLESVFQLQSYAELFRARSIRAGSCIFSDLERLTPAEAEQASRIRKTIKKSGQGAIMLNDPTRTMRRYELLRTLYEKGINQFNVYRVVESRLPERYPVFIRNENDHRGNRTPLLNNEGELQAAITELERKGRSRESMLIVEFLDTADETGVYRKYSYFMIAGKLIPRHLFLSNNWLLKRPDILDTNALAEERQFVESTPFLQEIHNIFRIARVDYGRIDFALYKDRVQVWEINTNPQITGRDDRGIEFRGDVQRQFAEQYHRLLMEIHGEPGCRVPLRINAGKKTFLQKIFN